MTNKEFEHHITKANTPNLTKQEYQETKRFLLNCQSTFIPPHSYIPRVNVALQALEHNKPNNVRFYQTTFGYFTCGIAITVLGYGCLLLLGWVTLPK